MRRRTPARTAFGFSLSSFAPLVLPRRLRFRLHLRSLSEHSFEISLCASVSRHIFSTRMPANEQLFLILLLFSSSSSFPLLRPILNPSKCINTQQYNVNEGSARTSEAAAARKANKEESISIYTESLLICQCIFCRSPPPFPRSN